MKYDIEVGFGTYLNQFFLNKKKRFYFRIRFSENLKFSDCVIHLRKIGNVLV